MASAGERSHHGDGPISPGPAGSGSRSLWRCSMVAQAAAGGQREGGSGGRCPCEAAARELVGSKYCSRWPSC